MGFDLTELKTAVAQHGRVIRVVIASVQGSSPREVGAAMLVWQNGQSGTIGGGALEYHAAQTARLMQGGPMLSRHSLGPDLGQCCGGSVQLLSEVFDAISISDLTRDNVVARATRRGAAMPMTVSRLLATARAGQNIVRSQLLDGWMIEPLAQATRQLWIWGAGHVGRAFVDVMAPLPDVAINWLDTDLARFPDQIPDGVLQTAANNPADLVAHAPRGAEHLIVTYSHAIDLELCHSLLTHGFGFAGLIGSKSKWARFRGRLQTLGHAPTQIDRITCPIGNPGLGKHPQALAIGVAAAFLQPKIVVEHIKENCA